MISNVTMVLVLPVPPHTTPRPLITIPLTIVTTALIIVPTIIITIEEVVVMTNLGRVSHLTLLSVSLKPWLRPPYHQIHHLDQHRFTVS